MHSTQAIHKGAFFSFFVTIPVAVLGNAHLSLGDKNMDIHTVTNFENGGSVFSVMDASSVFLFLSFIV